MSTVSDKKTMISDNNAIISGNNTTISTSNVDIANNMQKVYDAGYEAYHKAWWDTYTAENTRGSYVNAFEYSGWTDKTFDPPYQLKPTNLQAAFAFSKITKLSKSQIDTSLTTEFYRCFQQSGKEIEELSLESAERTEGMFRDSTCHTIHKMIFNAEGTTVLTSLFQSSRALKHVHEVEGLIAGDDFNAQFTVFTAETAINFIKCFANYAGTENENVYTATFSSSTKTALEAEGDTSPNGNSWIEYIADLGWRLG